MLLMFYSSPNPKCGHTLHVPSHKMVKSLSRSISNKRVLVVKWNCSFARRLFNVIFNTGVKTATCIISPKFLLSERGACVISVLHGNNNNSSLSLFLSLSTLPVYSSLLQVGLVVAMFAVFPDQFVGMRLVRCVFRHQGDANSQGAVVVVHLQVEYVTHHWFPRALFFFFLFLNACCLRLDTAQMEQSFFYNGSNIFRNYNTRKKSTRVDSQEKEFDIFEQ